MRILIDTHLLLWWLNNDDQLSVTARNLIENPSNTILVSAVTTWEIWLKNGIGKLELPDNFEEVLDQEEFESLPLTAAHTRVAGKLPWHHRDPFDRLLVAQAQAGDLTLLTSDGELTAYGRFVKKV